MTKGPSKNDEIQILRSRIRTLELLLDVYEKSMPEKSDDFIKEIDWHHQMDKKLEYERKQLLSLFNSIDDMIYICDPHTYEILYTNDALNRLFGKDPVGGICYKKFQNLEHPCGFCTNKIILKNKYKPYKWDYHNPVLNRDFEIIDRIIKWSDGRDVRFESARDITDRKRTELVLRESNEKLRALIETTSDWVWEVDRNGTFTYASPKVKDLLGYEPEEIIGKTLFDMMDSDEAERVTGLFEKNAASATSFRGLENIIRHKNGRYVVVETNGVPVFDEKGDLVGYRGIDQDITLRKKAENALIKERNRNQIALNFYRRADARIQDVEAFIIEECIKISESQIGFLGFINKDETLMRATLWSEKAMEGCAIDFKPVAFSLDHAGIWAEAIREHKPVIVNDYLKPDPRKKGYPEGHVTIQRLMSIPLIKGAKAVAILAVANKKTDYDETDLLQLSLFIESMWDLLKRIEAEDDLRILNEELERKVEERTNQLLEAQEELIRREKLAILGQLAGNVGHEIRNPLGVMSNAVYFLKNVMPDADDTVREYLGIINSEIDNSLRIITDLFDFAHAKIPQVGPVDVNALVEKALSKYAMPGNIRTVMDIPDSIPLIEADIPQMKQVLNNIITNAVQAMSGGGKLHIKATLSREAESREEGEESAFVKITVSDTGTGISPENMKNLFNPLFTTKPKGIGLGLVICKKLVEANGGGITVETLPGKGTTFSIMLPALR